MKLMQKKCRIRLPRTKSAKALEWEKRRDVLVSWLEGKKGRWRGGGE